MVGKTLDALLCGIMRSLEEVWRARFFNVKTYIGLLVQNVFADLDVLPKAYKEGGKL